MATRRKVAPRRTSKNEYFQRACRHYMQHFGVKEVDPDAVAQWMIDTGQYEERPYSTVKRCKRELVRALRDQKEKDPADREVRSMHPITWHENGEAHSLWSHLYDMHPAKAHASLRLRVRQVEAQVKQVETDRLSYNDFNIHGAQLPLFDYDLNKTLTESSLPTEYSDEPPADHDVLGDQDSE